MFPHVELKEALETHHYSDSHLQPITESEAPSSIMPRLTLDSVDILRGEGVRLVKSVSMVDLDRVPHAPWPSVIDRDSAFEALVTEFPEAYAVYMTRAGARLAFRTDEPLDLDASEGWERGLIEQIVIPRLSPKWGLQADITSSQPGRIFRLPWVLRDGQSSAGAPLLVRNDTRISLSRVKASVGPVGGPTPQDMPEVPERVDKSSARWNAAGLGEWSEVERLPRVDEPWPDGTPSPGRDETMVRLVGRAASYLVAANYGDPAREIWELLSPIVSMDDEPSLEKTWAKCQEWTHREQTQPKTADGRRTVRLTGDDMTDAKSLFGALLERYAGRIFRKGATLVLLNEDTELEPVTKASLRALVANSAAIPTKKGYARPGDQLLETMLGSVSLGTIDVPAVNSLERMPPIREDGTVRMAPGLETASGTLYAPPEGVTFPDPSGDPMDVWRRFLRGFLDYRPSSGFRHDRDFAAYIAAALGMMLGPQLPSAPMLVIDANRAGAGKTLLLDILAIVFEGKRSGGRIPNNDGRWDLDLRTWAKAGRRFIWFDDVAGEVGCPSLDRALTGQFISGRNLHTTDHSGDFKFRPSIVVSSNNLEVIGATKRRTLFVELKARGDFRPPKWFHSEALREEARKRRGELYMALVGMFRDYVEAGCPDLRQPGVGAVRRGPLLKSFEVWDQLAGNAACWATGIDPTGHQADTAEAADPGTGAVEDIIRFAPRDRLWSAAELIDAAIRKGGEIDQALRVLMDTHAAAWITPTALARKLKQYDGMEYDDMVLLFEKRGAHSKFRVIPVDVTRVRP